MEPKRIYELLTAERACILRSNKCNRDCKNCELVQNEEELLLMYDILIMLIGSLIPKWKKNKDETERNN